MKKVKKIVEPARQLKRERLSDYIDIHCLQGNIQLIIDNLKDIKFKAFDKGYHIVEIDIDHYGEDLDVCYYGTRYETDQEYDIRLAVEEKLKEDKKKQKREAIEKEKAEYLRLKKKFEG